MSPLGQTDSFLYDQAALSYPIELSRRIETDMAPENLAYRYVAGVSEVLWSGYLTTRGLFEVLLAGAGGPVQLCRTQ